MSFWWPGRSWELLGEPRGVLGVLGVAFGWPRGRPESKSHDFAQTVAYFKGSQGSPPGPRATSIEHRLPYLGGGARPAKLLAS